MYQVPVLNNYEYQKSVINIEIDSSSILSPKKGERYLIGKSAINDWIDKDNQIILNQLIEKRKAKKQALLK